MKKKIMLFANTSDGNTFRDCAKEKLVRAGYTVITDVSPESINVHIGDTYCLIVLVQLTDTEFETFMLRSIYAIAQKYGVPLIGVKSNEWEWASETFWEARGVPLMYYDDFTLPFVGEKQLQREIEHYIEDESEVIVGYDSMTLQ